MFLPGAGGALGGLAGTALGAAAGGVGAVPGGAIGGTTGAAGGEAVRQFLSAITGGPRRSLGQSAKEVGTQAATEAVGLGMGRALPMMARGIGQVGRAATARIGQMTTPIATESIERVFERGAKQVITPEYQAFAKGGVPERIQASVIKGFEQFRDGAERTYDTAIKQLQPEIQQTSVNLTKALQDFRTRLIDSKVMSSTGKLVKTILGQQVVPEATASTKKLTSIFTRLQKIPSGILPTEQAIQLKRELDTLLDFDPNAITKMTKPAQAMLFGLRSSLKGAIEEAVPGLAQANNQYHIFRDLYDTIQPRLRDPNIETTLRSLTKNRNTFNFKVLEDIDQSLPPDQKFLAQTLDFLAGSEFGKNPELFRFLPFSIAGLLGAASGNPLMGGAALLTGAELTSPRAFGAGLRTAERIAKPMIRAGQTVASGISPVVSSILRLVGQRNAPATP